MGHRYIPITEELFTKHLGYDERYVFVSERDIPKKFKKLVEGIARQRGDLFVSECFIITDRLSSLAENEVKRIAKRNGYQVTFEMGSAQLRYLYSDGYGHYSTDFYEFLEYTQIHVTLFQPIKGDTHENS